MNNHLLCKHPAILKLRKARKEDIKLRKFPLIHGLAGLMENKNNEYEILCQRAGNTVNKYPDLSRRRTATFYNVSQPYSEVKDVLCVYACTCAFA